MIPWIWFWAPRIQYPYSGALSQWVQPNTSWFFDAIPPQAGIGEIEKKIFDVASYPERLKLLLAQMQVDVEALEDKRNAAAS